MMSTETQKFLDKKGLIQLIDQMDGKYIFRGDIVQTEGHDEGKVMSQDAVTRMMSRVYDFKGSKTFEELLAYTEVELAKALDERELEVGHVYNITNSYKDATYSINTGDNVAWNGEAWDPLAGIGDLSDYVKFEDEFITSIDYDSDTKVLSVNPNNTDGGNDNNSFDIIDLYTTNAIDSIVLETSKDPKYANQVLTATKFTMQDVYPDTYTTMRSISDIDYSAIVNPVKVTTSQTDDDPPQEVTTRTGMFQGCTALVAVGDLDTSNFIDMTNLFRGCTALTKVPAIDCSAITAASQLTNMFYGTAVTSVSFTNVDASITDESITSVLLKGDASITTIEVTHKE